MTGHASKRKAATDKLKPPPQWPFPTASKPAVPWTKKQIREYAAQQRQQMPEALI